MANVLCVLYDDPGRRLPAELRARRGSEDRGLPRRPDRADPGGRSASRPASWSAASPASSACGSSSRPAATRWSVTSDKDGPDSVFERELPKAEVVISQPFWPAYLTAERIAKAPNLKLALTAGIGSDHVDLQAAIEHGVTVAEVTYSNSISVAEHVVMMILALVRNYIPSYGVVVEGGWNIADCASRSYDLEGMQVGHGRRGADRLGGAAAAEAVRGRPPLHRAPPPAGRGRGGAGRHLPPHRRVDGRSLRRGDDQRAAAPRDREPLRRRAAGEDEARRLPDQHRPRQDLRPRRGRRRLRERPAGRATPATSGFRSRRRATIPGARCPTTA